MADAVAVPVGNVPSDVQHAVGEALGELIERVNSHDAILQKSQLVENHVRGQEQPKSWFADPFQLLDSLGMGYRAAPSSLTYDTLRAVSERDVAVASIIGTRVNQVAAFARPQENKYSVGFKIRPRGGDKRRRLTASEKEKIEDITQFVLNTGREFNLGRDSFDQFLRKFTRDRLTYDQACAEKVRTLGGSLHSFYCVPGDTIRIAHPRIPKGTPPALAEVKRTLKYIQIINAQPVTEFTMEELAFCVGNPRTNVKVFGYGFPEIEILMTTITSHMNAEAWNRAAFTQGSTIKGVLNLKGNLPAQALDSFKRAWTAQVSGINSAWKTPVLNTEAVEFIPMQMNNTEMGYQMWMEYLIKVTSAIFQIDPAEINFDLRGGVGQQPIFMSTNEAQQKVSKDRGLQPLLRFIEDHLNKHVVWAIDPRFELAFVGLDAKSEEQAMQLRMQQVQNVFTLNEIRAMEDLPPLKDGDVVLNPVYTGYTQQKAMAAQQAAMMQQNMGGQPGAAPGGQPGEEPNEPYSGQFGGRPQGDEEKQGAEKLRQFDEQQTGVAAGSPRDDEDSEDGDGNKVRDYIQLKQDDWGSTIRASMPEEDLKKSEPPRYITIDLG